MYPKRHVRVLNPIPANLRHTAANRNENSNNQKLKRDPVNRPYAFYTVNDIAKIFDITREKVIKLINAGYLNSIGKEGRLQKRIVNKGINGPEHRLCESREFMILAPNVLKFFRTYHSLHGVKNIPAFYPPVLILATAQFIDEYNPDGSERSQPHSAQTGHTIQQKIDEILAIIEFEREPYYRYMQKILGQSSTNQVVSRSSIVNEYLDFVKFADFS